MGSLIKERIRECNIELSHISEFINYSEAEIEKMFLWECFDSMLLLKYCTLLEYDFFRVYSQHLILYAPPANIISDEISDKKSLLPLLSKNIYTKEIIDFILEQINTGNKTSKEVIEEYRIPKTTLHTWRTKYTDK